MLFNTLFCVKGRQIGYGEEVESNLIPSSESALQKRSITYTSVDAKQKSDEEQWEYVNMTPFDDFMYLLNAVLLGEEPTIEDFILLIGTIVAFVAFILWCCFPVVPKEAGTPSQYDSRSYGQYKKFENAYHYEITS